MIVLPLTAEKPNDQFAMKLIFIDHRGWIPVIMMTIFRSVFPLNQHCFFYDFTDILSLLQMFIAARA